MKPSKQEATASAFSLLVSLPKAVFRPEEPIRLDVLFENISDRVLEYGVQGTEFDYVIECKDEHGQAVPLTRYGQRLEANRGMGRFLVCKISPGEHLSAEISVTRQLDLSLAGRYTLTVRREVFPHQGDTAPPVVSNACAFEIVED